VVLVPSVYRIIQGPVPVNATLIEEVEPSAQMDPPPEIAAVGDVFTATTAEPLTVPEHCALDTDTRV
jgi:uncharacterized protein (UPF0218 family)